MNGTKKNNDEAPPGEAPKAVQRDLAWGPVLFHIHLNMSALYGLFLVFTVARVYTALLALLLTVWGTLGITIGSHRLWAHGSYKANWLLRSVLLGFQTLCCVGPVYNWVREHRAHHQLRGTEYDKFDHRQGFLFGHILSHCVNVDPRITQAEENVDMSDLERDPLVMYQKRLYWVVAPLLGLLLPINAPLEYWNETVLVSVFVVGFLRVVLLWHAAWLVNSANILWGLDPTDRKSGDTVLVFFFNKSLWPSYHYLLPWDYKSGEYGTYNYGFSTAMLRVCAALGLAYDLTTCTSSGIHRALKAASDDKGPLVDCLLESKVTCAMHEVLDNREFD